MRIALATLVVSVAAAATQAQNLTTATIVGGMVDSDWREVHEANNPNLVELTVAGTNGTSYAAARIAPGVNSVYTHWESLNASTPTSMLMADARTYWTDTLLISDPNLNGTVGTFTASLRVYGNASFNLTGGYASGDWTNYAYVYGFWDSWIGTRNVGFNGPNERGGFLVGGWFGNWQSDETGTVYYTGDELNQPMTEVSLEFIYGVPFELRMNMEAYFDAQNTELLPGTVEGTLDFSHTAYWNGIGEFRDVNGNVTNPDYWSQSGINWRDAVVPEPTTIMALMVGIAGILRRRRT